MTQVPCSTLAGGALGAGLHVLIYSGLSQGPGSYYALPRWMQMSCVPFLMQEVFEAAVSRVAVGSAALLGQWKRRKHWLVN